MHHITVLIYNLKNLILARAFTQFMVLFVCIHGGKVKICKQSTDFTV